MFVTYLWLFSFDWCECTFILKVTDEKNWIRIRIKTSRIRNTALKGGNYEENEIFFVFISPDYSNSQKLPVQVWFCDPMFCKTFYMMPVFFF